jgi:hypothetical protein
MNGRRRPVSQQAVRHGVKRRVNLFRAKGLGESPCVGSSVRRHAFRVQVQSRRSSRLTWDVRSSIIAEPADALPIECRA